jgi:hypothetical protein
MDQVQEWLAGNSVGEVESLRKEETGVLFFSIRV